MEVKSYTVRVRMEWTFEDVVEVEARTDKEALERACERGACGWSEARRTHVDAEILSATPESKTDETR